MPEGEVSPWDRKFWGVVVMPRSKEGHILGPLGESWDSRHADVVRGSIFAAQRPSRVLLFMTRREARAWCRERGPRFRVVRVRERVGAA